MRFELETADPREPLDITAMRAAIMRATHSIGFRALSLSMEQVRRLIRIEVDQEAAIKLRYQTNPIYPEARHAYGPKQYMGIDLYVVDVLPPPGWRVINPLDPS